jgi:hypothetical protein
VQGQ